MLQYVAMPFHNERHPHWNTTWHQFTKNTLRFAWHVTSIAWWGFAALLIAMAGGPPGLQTLGMIIGATFLVHFVITLVASRGRHFAWPVFLAIGSLAIYATSG